MYSQKRIHLKKMFESVTLYPVTNKELSNGKTNHQVVKEVLNGGAKIIQLRNKTSSKKEILKEALQIRELTQQYNALFIINDHLDIALKACADGIHLGQNDVSPKEVRLKNKNILIGISCSSIKDIQKANEMDIDYVNFGPIFKTNTKINAHPISPNFIDNGKQITHHPFTVMGGINFNNVDTLLKKDVKKIAVISAVVNQPNIEKATSDFIKKIKSFSTS